MSGELARGEFTAVIGLARSGEAVAELLRQDGTRVYASDAADTSDLKAVAARLRALGVDVQLGGHDLERIARAREVVVSPGVRPDAAPVRAARKAGVPVLSEVAVALSHLRQSKVVVVTGTNGKSTTTALIAHLLEAVGREALAAGNIGRALSEVALEPRAPEWIALELSSFQLHDTPDLRPIVGVLTNLSPDHLDRYDSVEAYYGDKQRMFEAADPDSTWVSNADDDAVQRLTEDVQGSHYRFSLEGAADAWYERDSQTLYLLGERVCSRRELQLIGEHNVANALAALLAVAVAVPKREAVAIDRLAEGLRSFTGLAHRLELVAELDGVLWVNDSKATNVESARMAVRAMDRPTILLLGGKHKGDSYRPLLNAAAAPLRLVIAFGEAGGVIEQDLAGSDVPIERLSSDFAAVVRRAREAARTGDAVLLAPACSSYDMFDDYEQRGNVFKSLVMGTAA